MSLHTHTVPLALSPLALIGTARALLHSKIINVNLTFESVKINTLPVFISFHICQSYLDVFQIFKKASASELYGLHEWEDNFPLDSGQLL